MSTVYFSLRNRRTEKLKYLEYGQLLCNTIERDRLVHSPYLYDSINKNRYSKYKHKGSARVKYILQIYWYSILDYDMCIVYI